MKKRRTVFIIATALAFLLTSCTTTQLVSNPDTGDSSPIHTEASQPPATVSTPTAIPQSSVQTIMEMETNLEQAIRDNLRFNVASMLPEGEDADRLYINLYNYSESQWILSVRDYVNAAIQAAVAQAKGNFFAGQEVQFATQLTAPSWQYLYMLAQMAEEDISTYDEYIKSSLSVQVSADSQGGETVITVCVEPVYYRDAILAVVDDDRIAFLDAESAFDYMNTVFDENLAEKEYVLPPAEGNLTTGLTWPVQRFIRLRKTWYAARDGGARKHTGTDIWAAEGTEIYSCTDGVVFYIGYWGGGGNTVVVVDDYGYMYYYHHMVCITDFLQEGQRVEAGQLIGHVGNTGNSARDHLHLTIVHPDGMLVDPYTYLKDAMPD